MSDSTTRDVAWYGVLKALSSHDTVTPDDVLATVELPEEKRRTVKRVMRAMEEFGLLDRPHSRAHSWERADHFTTLLSQLDVAQLEIAASALAVRDRQREGAEILVEDVRDDVVEEYPSDVEEDDVEAVMHLLARAGLLEERDALMHTAFENPAVEPSECEWCGAPFPEAGRRDVTEYDPDGRPLESVSICSSCLSEQY